MTVNCNVMFIAMIESKLTGEKLTVPLQNILEKSND